MKTHILVVGALALAMLGVATTAIVADDKSAQSGTLTENEMIFQSNRLGNLDVYSQQNSEKKLGNLDNLLINAHKGQLLYGVLDTGVGGKMIPVPWDALRLHKTVKDNQSRYWLTLNKTERELAQAPTLDKDHWPDFTNSPWKRSVDDFFGTRTVTGPERAAEPGQLTTNQMIFQSSKLADLNVHNRDDASKKLGNLDNLIINAHTGQVLYGILDTGIGGKNVPVPWTALQLQKEANQDQYRLLLDKTQDQLANAPTFDKEQWPDFTGSEWQRNVDRFFGVRTAARPKR